MAAVSGSMKLNATEPAPRSEDFRLGVSVTSRAECGIAWSVHESHLPRSVCHRAIRFLHRIQILRAGSNSIPAYWESGSCWYICPIDWC